MPMYCRTEERIRGTLLAHWTRYMDFCSQSQLITLESGAAKPAAEPSLASHDGLMQGNINLECY